ncbi:MAG: sugar phosphate nucleotidyltransferase [Fimbriimonadaceae bacterium]
MIDRGIVLAGGSGSRLWPVTRALSKQLVPIYDKPMVYYPLSVLMLAGLRKVLIITTPEDRPAFEKLLGDGSSWGMSISFAEQPKPEGLAQAFIIGEDFLREPPRPDEWRGEGAGGVGPSGTALVLGDNIFYGVGLSGMVQEAARLSEGATVFAYPVENPSDYGVVSFDSSGKADSIEEKPASPRSRFAVTGLYFYDHTVVSKANNLRPSSRGELEITDLNRAYLAEGKLNVTTMGRGFAWLDTGTHHSMLQAANFVEVIQQRQGLLISCPEEIAFRRGWISAQQLESLAKPMAKNGYGQYLLRLASEE